MMCITALPSPDCAVIAMGHDTQVTYMSLDFGLRLRAYLANMLEMNVCCIWQYGPNGNGFSSKHCGTFKRLTPEGNNEFPGARYGVWHWSRLVVLLFSHHTFICATSFRDSGTRGSEDVVTPSSEEPAEEVPS